MQGLGVVCVFHCCVCFFKVRNEEMQNSDLYDISTFSHLVISTGYKLPIPNKKCSAKWGGGGGRGTIQTRY